MGSPTVLRHSKDFRALLGWDFTQFSAFNASNSMVLVSSVKSSSIMDRRGYMAVLALDQGDYVLLNQLNMQWFQWSHCRNSYPVLSNA